MEGGIYEEMHSTELVQSAVVQSAAIAIFVAVAVSASVVVSAIGELGLSGIGVCSSSKGVGNTDKETESEQVSKGLLRSKISQYCIKAQNNTKILKSKSHLGFQGKGKAQIH